jgi:hypothetical protein
MNEYSVGILTREQLASYDQVRPKHVVQFHFNFNAILL